MKKTYWISAAALLAFWQIASMNVANNILIPSPKETMEAVFKLFISASFYQAACATLLRIAKGYFVSLAFALVITILCDRFSFLRDLLHPLLVMIRTIPNISYIVMALIWLGAEGAVSAVCFMILFPVFSSSFNACIEHADPLLKDVERLYPETFLAHVRCRLFPELWNDFLSCGKTAASLGLKVGIMAEILGQVRNGIGRAMNYARLNLDTSVILAWTVVIILISLLIDRGFVQLAAWQKRREQ